MTETRDELFGRGWRPQIETRPLLTRDDYNEFLEDLDIVYAMVCPKCKDPKPKGGLRLETWSKRGRWDKSFTVCRTCGHRRPF